MGTELTSFGKWSSIHHRTNIFVKLYYIESDAQFLVFDHFQEAPDQEVLCVLHFETKNSEKFRFGCLHVTTIHFVLIFDNQKKVSNFDPSDFQEKLKFQSRDLKHGWLEFLWPRKSDYAFFRTGIAGEGFHVARHSAGTIFPSCFAPVYFKVSSTTRRTTPRLRLRTYFLMEMRGKTKSRCRQEREPETIPRKTREKLFAHSGPAVLGGCHTTQEFQIQPLFGTIALEKVRLQLRLG